MGDAFPRLGPAPDRQFELEQHRASAPPAFEEHVAPPTTPALVVHVDVCFTDPVIRSRYSRSYASSPTFQATNRISRGLVRRIERCCEELITRKDSGALEMFKGDTCERKPQRFDMAFRITTRGKGDWAERTYRSYQKHPLTVAFTKEVILETHRMIGLFLRRHDDKFQWLDCPVSETEAEGGETRAAPFRPGSASLLSVPRAHFMEAAQKFDFVPGYAIELCFRSQNPQRRVPVYERRIQIDSKQTAPLPRFLSEDVLSKALHSINQGLDSKKREFDDHLQDHRAPEPPDAQGDGLEIELKVINNLGPAYNLVQKSIKTHLVLFRDQDAVDCDLFLHHAEKHLSHHRSDADSAMHAMNDFEFRLVELKGFGWTLRDPAKLALGPSASYSRRTIQAALDRIQTGIGDVIRGHNIAMRIKAHKRGHVVLDKAIVAHEKHGKPRETFASRDDAQATFVARLKARIQRDIDRVFEDSCCIDDIPEDEEDSVARPVTPGLSVFEGLSPKYSPSSIRPSLAWQSRPAPSSAQSFSRPRAQRVFSLSRGSRESFMSIDSLTPNRGGLTQDDSRPSTAPSEQVPESPARDSVFEPRGGLLAPAEVKPSQSFSLVLARSPSATHINNRASLVELPTDIQPLGETRASDGMTSLEGEVDPVTALAGNFPEEGALESCSTSIPELRQDETPSRDYKTIDAPSPVPGAAAGKMDTPTTFEDAREYVTSPVSEEKTTSGALFALAQTESTREEDEFSTAPSTPELSTGGSSPRHSMLETPLLPRFDSVARETVLRDTYPDSGTERPAAHLQGESTVEPVLKENRDPSAAPKPHIDQQQEQEPSRLLPSPAEQSTTLKGPEGPEPVPDDANKIHDAEGRTAVTLDETTTPDVHPTTQTQTPTLTTRPSSTTAPKAEPEPEPKPAVSQIDDDTAQLGAETPDISPRFPAPDSPTPEVRTSSHAPGAQEAGHHSEHVSGSGTPPELVQSTTEAPEQQAVTQVHGEGPESTTVDAGQGDDALPARETTPAGGPESHGNVAKGDDAGGMHQDVDSEAQVTGPDGEEQLMPDPDRVEEERCESESPSEHPDDGDDGRHGIQPVLSEAPATAPDVRADEAEPAVTHQVMGKSDAVPALDRDAGAEYSVAEISGGAKMGLDVLSAPTEQAEPGQGENDIGDEAGEEPGLAPLGNSVAQPTGLDGREEHLISEEVQSEPTSASALVEPAGTEAPELDIDAKRELPGGTEAPVDGAVGELPAPDSELGAGEEEFDGTVDVDIEPEPQEPQSYNGHAATAASFSNLDTSPQETSTTRAEISNHASSADTTILPTTVPRSEDDSATPKPVSLPPPAQQKPEKPHLAPIPDLSRLFPAAPARTSLSSLSDAASFTTSSSITRNSVDTIRPSADDERQRPGGGGGGMAALPELLPPHTSSSSTRSNSRPRTAAGYLCHLGLCEPRSLEVGLRGALGDVKTRRLSLPLQRMLDKGPPATEKVSGAAAVSGAESEDGAGAVGEGEQSVLPRMMMLLAGAVAIGKIMKSVDERAMI
ncbi:hypothetical protein N658DRAFT_416055 [Parathielavia hyrcaniae]|uniref:Pt repeat family protein n=1 Tax=Parathielavia hyrcaniae TaxID=113614 RepID=A0AAN6Q8J2_9PEZI|nr:hypothetical protein N658DRAFT_416055 [Parathielavia hyrcaniae]